MFPYYSYISFACRLLISYSKEAANSHSHTSICQTQRTRGRLGGGITEAISINPHHHTATQIGKWVRHPQGLVVEIQASESALTP